MPHEITTLEELDAIYGEPVKAAQIKEIDYISDHYRALHRGVAVPGPGHVRLRGARLLAARRSQRVSCAWWTATPS